MNTNMIDVVAMPARGNGYILRCNQCLKLFVSTLRDCGTHVKCPYGECEAERNVVEMLEAYDKKQEGK